VKLSLARFAVAQPYGNAAKRAVDKWNGRFELAHPEEVSIDD